MRTVSLALAADVTLGRQRAPQYETGEHVVPYLRSANINDGRLALADVKQMNFTVAEQRVFGLRPGDVLVTEGSGSRDTVGASAVWQGEIDGTVCFQNTLLRLRPRAGWTDGRYLAWWTRHAHASGLMAAVASGANILHLGAEELRGLSIALPPLDEQRRIADFLDDQVGRIDGVATSRQRQLELLDERIETMIGAHIASATRGGADPPMLPIKQLLSKQFRLVAPEAPMVTAFRDGQVIARELRRSEGFTEAWIDGSVMQGVRSGDVVIHGLDGFAGAIGTSESDGICSPANHVCEPLDGGDSDYYGRMLRILALSGYLSLYGGSARERAVDFRNWQKFAAIPLPVVPLVQQVAIGEAIRQGRPLRREVAGLTDLLQERKRALITAAVTGEFDVSTASGRP